MMLPQRMKPPDHCLHPSIVVGRWHVDGLPSGSFWDGTISIVQSFVEAFKQPLQQPLIVSPTRLYITKDPKVADDSDFVPKRSACLAAKSKFKEVKSDAQARKVLIKKLGPEVEMDKPDEASFEEFQQVVATTLLHVKQEAMEAFFLGRWHIRGLVRDVE